MGASLMGSFFLIINITASQLICSMDRLNMAEKGVVHVLLVSLAAQGLLNPLLRFGQLLLSNGLRVSLATTGVSRERLLAANKTTKDASNESEIHLEFFSDGFDSSDTEKYKDSDMYMEKMERAGRNNLSELLKTLANDGYPVSCTVSNPLVPWVIDVSEEQGIPCALLWTQPCSVYALYYRFYLGLNQFPDLTKKDIDLDLPGLPSLHREDLPTFLLPSNPIKSLSKAFNQVFQNLKRVRWVLANSFYELEREAIESMVDVHPIKPVGPLVPPALLGKEENGDSVGADMWKAAEECLDWLNTKPACSVVYVSFGSILVLCREQMENLACGLRNSGRPFLWVVKHPEYMFEGGELPEGFLEETAEQGLVVTWCPQVKVLSHPSIACFLTHCGWNSILETIATGVPVIAFPHWTDQPTNAKLLVDVFRLGLRLEKDEEHGMVSAEEVERCIVEITQGPKSQEWKEVASEWKKAAEAAAVGGSSDRNIQFFVDQLVGGGFTDEKRRNNSEKREQEALESA